MPRIRRYYPVSHDLNRDPEMIRLRKETADWMGYVWHEMMAWGDKTEGVLKGKVETIAESLSGVSLTKRPSLSCKLIINALTLMQEFGWIIIESDRILLANYAEYHKTRDTNQIPTGNLTNPPFLPSYQPNEQEEEERKEEEEEKKNSAQTVPLDKATSTLDASSSKSNHPHEIEVYKAITRRLPPATSWPRVCLLFKGKETDELHAYFVEWRARGYLAKNIGWLDWVEDGKIPTKSRGSPQVKGHDPVTEKLMREFQEEEAANGKQGAGNKGDDAIDAKFSRLAKGTG